MNAATQSDVIPAAPSARRLLHRFVLATGFLALAFLSPLLQLISFAWNSEFFSCILLVPFISGYLIWLTRKSLRSVAVRPCWPGAAAGWIVGLAMITVYWLCRHGGLAPQIQDYLTMMTLAFLCCFWGLCLAILGAGMSVRMFFPLAFLLFAVPMPTVWMNHMDAFFQYSSAFAAEGCYRLTGEPVLRDGLNLQLSGFSLRVAPECSGIHSTLVLLMTGFLTDYLFLRRFWTRAVLLAAVIPLAILRNGFRIFVIGWLCVHVSPAMIHSPIHVHGGPLFFVLSLIPFFLLLMFLRKHDFNNPTP